MAKKDAKKWATYTEEQIVLNKKKYCVHCIYRTGTVSRSRENAFGVYCDYIAYNHKSRPCDAMNCTEFVRESDKTRLTRPEIPESEKWLFGKQGDWR